MTRRTMNLPNALLLIGRLLMAGLFAAGAVQKWVAPAAAQVLLTDAGLPGLLIWPALIFNAVGAVLLVSGLYLAPAAAALSLYCLAISYFHFIPDDPWQMSIVIKNWAIAGGLLVLCAHALQRPRT